MPSFMDLRSKLLVKLLAGDVKAGAGASFGTALTSMDAGTTAKLMKSIPKMDPAGTFAVVSDTIRGFGYLDQLFRLMPASPAGFRIVSYRSGNCLDAGDWFYNPGGSRTNVRHLVFKPVDASSQSQVFTIEKVGGASDNAGMLVCTVQGEKFRLTPNDWPAKEWVLVTLGKSFDGAPGDLFSVEIQPVNTSINVKVNNNLKFAVEFAVRWPGGQSPPVRVDWDKSGTITLDGFTPPRGTSCWLVGLKAKLGKDHESGDNFTIALPLNDPYVEYSLNEGFYMNFTSRFYG